MKYAVRCCGGIITMDARCQLGQRNLIPWCVAPIKTQAGWVTRGRAFFYQLEAALNLGFLGGAQIKIGGVVETQDKVMSKTGALACG